MSQTSRIAHIVDVGTPPSSLSMSKENEWEIINVRYHGFENLTVVRGEAVVSPEFTCFGHQWCLKLYPGGGSTSEDGMVGIFLHNLSTRSITLQYGYSFKNERHKLIKDYFTKKEGSEFTARGSNSNRGRSNFCERNTIIDSLIYGTLIIEVRMRQIVGTDICSPFIPENPHSKTIIKLFNDEESADIVFELDADGSGRHTRKRAKTTTTFHAHRLILQQCSSTVLNELCKSGGEAVSTVSITDVKPEVFKHMLYYVYGGKIAEKDMEENAKEIIHAADKYGIVGLKLEAEASFVISSDITFDNAIDNLLYADATNCALIKELVLDFIAQNRKEAVNKLSFDNVPGSAMKDLLAAVNRDDNKGGSTTNANDFSMMRVSTLRKMLDEKGLDIDGSREMMIATLKETV